MGSLVEGYCGVEPFAIDQGVTVAYGGYEPPWLAHYEDELRVRGGTAGLLAAHLPEDVADWHGGQLADAYVLSLDNAMTERTEGS